MDHGFRRVSLSEATLGSGACGKSVFWTVRPKSAPCVDLQSSLTRLPSIEKSSNVRPPYSPLLAEKFLCSEATSNACPALAMHDLPTSGAPH